MRIRIEHLLGLLLGLLLGAAPFLAFAQSDDEESYVYATYYVCDVTQQQDADEITASSFAPIYDAAVEDGLITGWGWLAHQTGGPWRRLFYMTAPSIGDLLDAQAFFVEEEDEDDNEAFGEICNSHDDYIWRRLDGSPAGEARGSVSLSAYYECVQGRESQADEIVSTVLAPIYEDQVDAGLLVSWGWNEHMVGGKYRRLATMTAGDWNSLFEARDNLIEATDGNELVSQLFTVCSSHADYMWDIQMENP
jgi:hypothetical protein